jgi:hypothetical protein
MVMRAGVRTTAARTTAASEAPTAERAATRRVRGPSATVLTERSRCRRTPEDRRGPRLRRVPYECTPNSHESLPRREGVQRTRVVWDRCTACPNRRGGRRATRSPRSRHRAPAHLPGRCREPPTLSVPAFARIDDRRPSGRPIGPRGRAPVHYSLSVALDPPSASLHSPPPPRRPFPSLSPALPPSTPPPRSRLSS